MENEEKLLFPCFERKWTKKGCGKFRKIRMRWPEVTEEKLGERWGSGSHLVEWPGGDLGSQGSFSTLSNKPFAFSPSQYPRLQQFWVFPSLSFSKVPHQNWLAFLSFFLVGFSPPHKCSFQLSLIYCTSMLLPSYLLSNFQYCSTFISPPFLLFLQVHVF